MLKYGYEVRHTPTLRFIIHPNVLGKHRLTWRAVCCCAQYAFMVTSMVQFAGGVVVFFGLLTSPKEVGKEGSKELFPSCAVMSTSTKIMKSICNIGYVLGKLGNIESNVSVPLFFAYNQWDIFFNREIEIMVALLSHKRSPKCSWKCHFSQWLLVLLSFYLVILFANFLLIHVFKKKKKWINITFKKTDYLLFVTCRPSFNRKRTF